MSISGGEGGRRGEKANILCELHPWTWMMYARVLTDKMGVLMLKSHSDRLALLPTSIGVISADTSLSSHSVYHSRSVCFLFPIPSQMCVRNPCHKVKAGGSEALTWIHTRPSKNSLARSEKKTEQDESRSSTVQSNWIYFIPGNGIYQPACTLQQLTSKCVKSWQFAIAGLLVYLKVLGS